MHIFRDETYGRRNTIVAIVLGAVILVPLELWVALGNATAGYLLGGLALFAVLAFLGRHMFAPGIHWTHLQGGAMPPEYHEELDDLRDRVTYSDRDDEERRG